MNVEKYKNRTGKTLLACHELYGLFLGIKSQSRDLETLYLKMETHTQTTQKRRRQMVVFLLNKIISFIYTVSHYLLSRYDSTNLIFALGLIGDLHA